MGPELLDALGLSGGTTSVLIATGELLIMTHSSGSVSLSGGCSGVFEGKRKLMREAVQEGEEVATEGEPDAPGDGVAFPWVPRVARIAAGFSAFGRCCSARSKDVPLPSSAGGCGILATDDTPLECVADIPQYSVDCTWRVLDLFDCSLASILLGDDSRCGGTTRQRAR